MQEASQGNKSGQRRTPDTEESCGDMFPELEREGDDVDDVERVGDTGSAGRAPKGPRLPALLRLVGVLGSLSIGTAGAKALLCKNMPDVGSCILE